MLSLNECKRRILSGEADEKLLSLYLDPSLLSYEKERYIEALDLFAGLYGDGDIAVFSAPDID